MRQQISLIGDCLNLASSGSSASAGAKQLCTYLPGIFTDNTSIDPDRLIPTRILQPLAKAVPNLHSILSQRLTTKPLILLVLLVLIAKST